MADGAKRSGRRYSQIKYRPPEGSTEILLVRHGESIPVDPANPFDLVEGRGDPGLSELGRAQAEALARRLEHVPLDAVYVTPLRRTLETAEPLLALHGLEASIEADLIELDMGEWEGGLYRQHITESDPRIAEVFTEQLWELIPGAESNESLFRRTKAGILRIAARHPGGRVVAVSHGISISAVLAQATHSAPFAFVGTDNASISVVVVVGEQLIIRRFNDSAHLESLEWDEPSDS
jgi:probable phosphoglycerate mutase